MRGLPKLLASAFICMAGCTSEHRAPATARYKSESVFRSGAWEVSALLDRLTDSVSCSATVKRDSSEWRHSLTVWKDFAAYRVDYQQGHVTSYVLQYDNQSPTGQRFPAVSGGSSVIISNSLYGDFRRLLGATQLQIRVATDSSFIVDTIDVTGIAAMHQFLLSSPKCRG